MTPLPLDWLPLRAALGLQQVGQVAAHGAEMLRCLARPIIAIHSGRQTPRPPSWPGLTRLPTPCRQGGASAAAARPLRTSACPSQQSGPRDGVDGRIKSGQDAIGHQDPVGRQNWVGRDEDMDAVVITAILAIQAVP